MTSPAINLGDVIEGWTVCRIESAANRSRDDGKLVWLLTLEKATPFDPFDYRVTEGPRKCWYGLPDLSEEGWEEYREWERFDFTEERYWRRLSDRKRPPPKERRTWVFDDEEVTL